MLQPPVALVISQEPDAMHPLGKTAFQNDLLKRICSIFFYFFTGKLLICYSPNLYW